MIASSPSRFKALYILNDPDTRVEAHAVRELVDRQEIPDLKVMEPLVPGREREVLIHYLLPFIVPDSMVVGFGVAGTIACYLQQEFSPMGLSVMAVNSPTDYNYMKLRRMDNRVALYSSQYEPIKDRCEWGQFAGTSLNVPWLQNGVFSESGGNLSKYAVAYYVTAYLHDANLQPAVESFSAQ